MNKEKLVKLMDFLDEMGYDIARINLAGSLIFELINRDERDKALEKLSANHQ